MNYYQKQVRNNELTIPDIERQIRNNQYKSKDELADHLLELRKKGSLNIDNGKIKELLDLFDSLNKKNDATLDLSNYSAYSLANTDLIVSQNEDRILTTLDGTIGYVDEFKKTQNEIISNNNEKKVSSNQVFEKIAKNKKNELELITLEEAFIHRNTSSELLMKIKFFVTNILINPNAFRINIETGIFYNMETNESYEVKKNEDNKTFEIYRINEKIAENSMTSEEENQELKLEDKSANERKQNKPKVRKRVTPKPYINNAAFSKIGFLMMSIITFALLTLMTILLMK